MPLPVIINYQHTVGEKGTQLHTFGDA